MSPAECRMILFVAGEGLESEHGVPCEHAWSREQGREECGATATNKLLAGSLFSNCEQSVILVGYKHPSVAQW